MDTKPSRRCYICETPILKKDVPTYDGHEFCSADCLLDAYVIDKGELPLGELPEFGDGVE